MRIIRTDVCIGGPKNGYQVSAIPDEFRVSGNAGLAVYRRAEIAGVELVFSVWLYEHTTPDQALEYLLAAYCKNPQMMAQADRGEIIRDD